MSRVYVQVLTLGCALVCPDATNVDACRYSGSVKPDPNWDMGAEWLDKEPKPGMIYKDVPVTPPRKR